VGGIPTLGPRGAGGASRARAWRRNGPDRSGQKVDAPDGHTGIEGASESKRRTEVEGKSQLVFDGTPQGRWKILKLLDDEFLASEMTSIKYEVNSKLPR
jgi:hypothetical protein